MTLRRFRWRIAATATALALASAILVEAAPSLAVGPGSMVSTSYGWKDPDCGTTAQTYVLRLFRDVNYGGTEWRFCSGNWPNLCWVPYGNDSSAALLCGGGYDGSTANDYPSSLKITLISGGSSCRIEVREDANYQGGRVVWWDPENVPTLVPWPSDVISSLRRVC